MKETRAQLHAQTADVLKAYDAGKLGGRKVQGRNANDRWSEVQTPFNSLSDFTFLRFAPAPEPSPEAWQVGDLLISDKGQIVRFECSSSASAFTGEVVKQGGEGWAVGFRTESWGRQFFRLHSRPTPEQLRVEANLKVRELCGDDPTKAQYRAAGVDHEWKDNADGSWFGLDLCGLEWRVKPDPTHEQARLANNKKLEQEWLESEKAFEIECRYADPGKRCGMDNWYPVFNGKSFDMPDVEHRRKPSPQLTPYTYADPLIGRIVEAKAGNPFRVAITAQDEHGVRLGAMEQTYAQLLAHWNELRPDESKVPYGKARE